MTAKALDLSISKDLEEFINTLKEFGFEITHNQPSRSISIRGGVEYFRYYGNNTFKLTIWSENAVLILCKCAEYYLISLYTPNKFSQFSLSENINITFEASYLMIEY